MTQQTNDQMIDELRAHYFHKRREVRLLENNDICPDNDLRGLATRFIDQHAASRAPDHTSRVTHFRTGDAAGAGELAAYSWINDGVFSNALGAVAYSHNSEYLRAYSGGAATRHFLARSITNAAANWQNKFMWGRFAAVKGGSIGLRIDTGADGTAGESYAEIYVNDVVHTGTYTVNFRYRINGAAAVIVPTSIAMPITVMVVLRLFSYYSGGNYYFYGYIMGEMGDAYLPDNFATGALGASGAPQAGRCGIIVNSDGVGTGYGYCDFLDNEFT